MTGDLLNLVQEGHKPAEIAWAMTSGVERELLLRCAVTRTFDRAHVMQYKSDTGNVEGVWAVMIHR